MAAVGLAIFPILSIILEIIPGIAPFGVHPSALFAEEGEDTEAVERFTAIQGRKAQLERDVIKAVSKVFREGEG